MCVAMAIGWARLVVAAVAAFAFTLASAAHPIALARAQGEWVWKCTSNQNEVCKGFKGSLPGAGAAWDLASGVSLRGTVSVGDGAPTTPVVSVHATVTLGSDSSDAVSIVEKYFSNGTGTALSWWNGPGGVECAAPRAVGLAAHLVLDPRLVLDVEQSGAVGATRHLSRGMELWVQGGSPVLAATAIGGGVATWSFVSYSEPAGSAAADIPAACHDAAPIFQQAVAHEGAWAPWVVDVLYPAQSGASGSASPLDDLGSSDPCACDGDPLADLPAPWWLVIVGVLGLALGCAGGFFIGYARHKKEAKRSLQYEPLVNLVRAWGLQLLCVERHRIDAHGTVLTTWCSCRSELVLQARAKVQQQFRVFTSTAPFYFMIRATSNPAATPNANEIEAAFHDRHPRCPHWFGVLAPSPTCTNRPAAFLMHR